MSAYHDEQMKRMKREQRKLERKLQGQKNRAVRKQTARLKRQNDKK